MPSLLLNEMNILNSEDIQFKLEALKTNTSSALPVQSNQSINRILSELKDQQRINEAALNMLKQRLVEESPPVYSTSHIRYNNPAALRSQNPYSSNGNNIVSTLPPIYSNNNSNANDYGVPGILGSVYDTALSPEEIRLILRL